MQASADTNENENSQPNVSTSDDLLINKNAIENVTACASANDNALNEIESFACDPSKKTLAAPEIRFEITDADFIEKSDLTAIADDDGKIQEFMDYIQNLDRKQSGDRLGFHEFPSDSQRQRYPSYNYDGKYEEDLNINILPQDIVEPFDDNEENSPQSRNINQIFLDNEKGVEVKGRRPMAVKRTLSLQTAPIDIDNANNTLSPNIKHFSRKSSLTDHLETSTNPSTPSFINELKFEHRPMQRIQKVDNFQSIVPSPPSISKGPSTCGSQESIAEIEFVFIENTDLPDLSTLALNEKKPPISRSISYSGQTIDSSSLENVIIRKESLNSSGSNSSSVKNSEQPGREGSWASVDSNRRYERSQSRYSDLEYINGRDDWRAVTSLHLNQQIDSDDYHHHRRYSETADTLEYIRGRDDWLQFEENRERCSTLPEIFEGKSRYDIKDEIDADEYHHHRCLSEIISYATKVSNNVFLAQGSARSGRSRSPYRLLRTDVNKTELIERYIWNGDESPDILYESSTSDGHTYGDRVQSERYIWIADSTKTRSQSPFTITIGENADSEADEMHIIIPNSSNIAGGSNTNIIDVSVVSDDNYEEPTVVIQEIIEHSGGSNEDIHFYTDVIETSADESIEVVVVNLKEEGSEQGSDEPIFVISEVNDCDKWDLTTTESITSDHQTSEENDIEQTVRQTTSEEGLLPSKTKEPNENKAKINNNKNERLNKDNACEVESSVVAESNLISDQFENQITSNLSADRLSAKNYQSDVEIIESKENCAETKAKETIGNAQYNPTALRPPVPAATNRQPNTSNITPRNKTTASTRPKTVQTIPNDNLEDLIKEGSLGPWFHK